MISSLRVPVAPPCTMTTLSTEQNQECQGYVADWPRAQHQESPDCPARYPVSAVPPEGPIACTSRCGSLDGLDPGRCAIPCQRCCAVDVGEISPALTVECQLGPRTGLASLRDFEVFCTETLKKFRCTLFGFEKNKSSTAPKQSSASPVTSRGQDPFSNPVQWVDKVEEEINKLFSQHSELSSHSIVRVDQNCYLVDGKLLDIDLVSLEDSSCIMTRSSGCRDEKWEPLLVTLQKSCTNTVSHPVPQHPSRNGSSSDISSAGMLTLGAVPAPSTPSSSSCSRENTQLSAQLSAGPPAPPSSFRVKQIRELHSAIRWNREKEVKRLLGSPSIGVYVAGAVDPSNGNTALHVAAQNGHSDLVEMLLALKICPDIQNSTGNTPMHMSVTYNHDKITQLLIFAGADRSKLNSKGYRSDNGMDGSRHKTFETWIEKEHGDGESPRRKLD